MVKAGKLKRSERRQPEAFPIIQLDDSSPTDAVTSNQNLHRPHQPPPPPQTALSTAPATAAKKGSTGRGKTRSKDQRAKAAKAIENAEKLAHRAQSNAARAEKKKRAKA